MFDAMYKTVSFENFKPERFLSQGSIEINGKEVPYQTVVKTMSSINQRRENLLQAFFPIPILGLMSKIERIDLLFLDLMAVLALLL